MPRYFFNLYDDNDVIGEEGLELAGAQAGRRQALRDARGLCEAVQAGPPEVAA